MGFLGYGRRFLAGNKRSFMYGCLRKGNDMDEFAARPVADILARYSTDNQNPVTIDVQVEKCREWCERNGYQVGKIFSCFRHERDPCRL